MPAPLALRVGTDADPAQIADAMAAIWLEIDTALAPVVGPRGVVALYQRSLHLTRAAHPWMVVTHEGVRAGLDPAPLKSVFAQQSCANAGAGGDALLKTFHELLATLIGPSLTERLLRSVWANSSDGKPSEDTRA